MVRTVSIVLLALSLTLALSSTLDWSRVPTIVAAPASTGLVFDYDCDKAPWRCNGARAESKYQVWAVECYESGCFWKWQSRANPGTSHLLGAGGRYRLFYGADNDFDNQGDYRYSGCSMESPAVDEICIEVLYQCSRNPHLCDGTNAWQLYGCQPRPDGSCAWHWMEELVGTSTGIYGIYPLEPYLLYWGPPRGLATATPTSSHTPTPTMTGTWTPTRAPSATPAASATTSASPTLEPSATSLPTRTSAASATARPAVTRNVFLPRLSR